MIHRFQRLRHDPIVGRDNKNDQVGYLGSAGAHCGKRFMAGRIQKSDHSTRSAHMIGPNMLGNSASLAAGNAGASNIVEQRSLAVIDVSHHGNNGRAWFCHDIMHLTFVCQERFGVIELRGLGNVPHFLHQDHCRFLVNDLIDRDHAAQLHQYLDDLSRFHRHFLRQCGNGYGFWNQHLANNGFWRGEYRLRNHGFRLVPSASTGTGMPTLTAATEIATRFQSAAFRCFIFPCVRLLDDLGFRCFFGCLAGGLV